MQTSAQKRARGQQRYRESLRRREDARRERREELIQMNFNLGIYLSLLVQGNLLRPHRYSDFRRLTMELFADYFQFGADPKEIQMFAKQDRFLSFSFSRDFVNLPVDGERHRGYKVLLDQWVMYTMLHERIMLKKISVESIGDVFLLTQIATLTISHRSIAILYPHMLNDFDFMDKVMGKQLTYETRQRAIFDANNQIISLQLEHGLAQGWNNILKNPEMVARILKQTLVDPNCYIDSTLEEIAQLTR